MTWTVRIAGRAKKQIDRLPEKIHSALVLLLTEVQTLGPVRSNWHHYGKLKGADGMHHCHLNKGRPRYVAVWKEAGGKIQLVEVVYAGTHEKAPY
ncbi:hypothetical protein MASR1M90_14580 [Desulfovibrionales bacterium]